MQIIEKREFLTPANTMSKYQRKFVIVGFKEDDVSKGCPICTCDTAKEAEYVYAHMKEFSASLKANDFYDFLILAGELTEGEVIIG